MGNNKCMPAYKATTMWPTAAAIAAAVAAATSSNKCLGLGNDFDFGFIKIAFHFGPCLSYINTHTHTLIQLGFSCTVCSLFTAATKWPKNFNEF